MPISQTEVRTRVTTEGVEQSASALRTLEGRLESLERQTQPTGNALSRFGSSIQGAFTSFSIITTGINSFLALAGRAWQAFKDIAEAADAYGDVVGGHRVNIESARIATNGLVSAMALHQQAARAEAAGLQLTSEQFRSLSVAAANYANRTGTDIDESFVQLTQSITIATARGLRPYGLELQRGLSRADQQRAILEQLTEQYGNQTTEIEGTADAITSLENAWSRAWGEMVLSIEQGSGPIQQILQTVTGWINEVANALETQRRAAEHLARMGTEQRQRQLQNDLLNAGYNRYGEQEPGAFAAVQRAGIATFMGVTGEEMDAIARQASAELGRLEQEAIDNIRHGREQVVNPEAPAAPTAPPAPHGGGGGRQQAREPEMVFLSAEEMIDQLAGEAGDMRDTFNSIWETQSEHISGLAELEEQRDQERRDRWNERKEQSISMYQKEIDLQQELFEASQRAAEKEAETTAARAAAIESAVDKVAGYGDALNTIGGAVANIFGQLSSEQKEGSKSAEKYKKIQGGILAGISFVYAAIEIAKAISDGAGFNYVGMAGHIASSVAYIAAGALALRNLGGSSQQPSGSSAGSFKPAEKPPASQATATGGTDVVIFTLGYGQGRLGRELVKASDAFPRSGLARNMAGAGAYG